MSSASPRARRRRHGRAPIRPGDELLARFDAIADRCGLEKIKRVGDEYMAVAGAPETRADTAVAAAEIALGLHEALALLRWPTGDVITVRIGIASGPAIAGDRLPEVRLRPWGHSQSGEPPRDE